MKTDRHLLTVKRIPASNASEKAVNLSSLHLVFRGGNKRWLAQVLPAFFTVSQICCFFRTFSLMCSIAVLNYVRMITSCSTTLGCQVNAPHQQQSIPFFGRLTFSLFKPATIFHFVTPENSTGIDFQWRQSAPCI
jgi:hypothetical protein